MPVLDQQVGAGHHAAVRAGQHRRVVAGADQRRLGLPQRAGDPLDQAGLTQLADGLE